MSVTRTTALHGAIRSTAAQLRALRQLLPPAEYEGVLETVASLLERERVLLDLARVLEAKRRAGVTGSERREALELHALIDQAFDLRETGYLVDACQAILDWWERRFERALAHRQARGAAILRAVRDSRRAT